MNPGYITYLCMFILLILLWMGWLRTFLLQIGIGEKGFATLLGLYFLFSFFVLPLGDYIRINVGLFLFPALLFFWVWGNEAGENRMNIFASFLLVGVNLFLLRYVIRIDPVLLVMNETFMVSIAAILLVLILGRDSKQVFLIGGMGVYFSELLYQGWIFFHEGQPFLGDGMFSDIILLSLLIALPLRKGIEWVMSCLTIRFNL